MRSNAVECSQMQSNAVECGRMQSNAARVPSSEMNEVDLDAELCFGGRILNPGDGIGIGIYYSHIWSQPRPKRMAQWRA